MVREGRWKEGRPQLLQIPRLMGLTLGLIAFGHVARAVAMRARPFGVRILAYDPFIEELVMSPYGVEPASLPELLQKSDIISMHAPATPEAYHMLKEEHFRMMKPTALFINTGRGPTVDEPALIKALEQGWIAGAGLDVLEQEPPDSNDPILKLDNVILAPHALCWTDQCFAGNGAADVRAVLDVQHGREPRLVVNKAVLATEAWKKRMAEFRARFGGQSEPVRQ
jgi:D-3-phosphoglycerate dehydrogenase / 2-oxoglutarate reductase